MDAATKKAIKSIALKRIYTILLPKPEQQDVKHDKWEVRMVAGNQLALIVRQPDGQSECFHIKITEVR